MSGEEVRYLSYDEAVKLVGAIQEEEDIRRPNHRILTVYNQEDKEICWFDFEDVMQAVGVTKTSEGAKEKVTEYIMQHIPDWGTEI